MKKETKRIQVNFCVPVSLELEVAWSAENECADIQSVSMSPIQSGISPQSLCEHLDDHDLQYLDEETKKAFEIEN